jgi:hypothetical protein
LQVQVLSPLLNCILDKCGHWKVTHNQTEGKR